MTQRRADAIGITELRLHGFRSARDVLLRPGPVCALVGEAGAGKSNVLAAIWRLLDATAPPLAPNDTTFGTSEAIELSARLADGRTIGLSAQPPLASQRSGPAAEVVFLPADLRAGLLAAPSKARISHQLRRTAQAPGEGRSKGAEGLVATVERLCAAGERGVVLLIEEPELYLRPQAQRYFYRLLRRQRELDAGGVLDQRNSPDQFRFRPDRGGFRARSANAQESYFPTCHSQ